MSYSAIQILPLIVLMHFVARLPSSVYGSDLSEFLHAAFDEHYQRQPSGPELNHQAQLARDYGPLENYISLLSSDEYFINRAHRDLETYITLLHRTLMARDPRPDEVRVWVLQFRQPGVRRESIVRRFCQANHITRPPGLSSQRPGFQPATTTSEIGAQLTLRTKLFINLVQADLGGSLYGQGVLEAAENLLVTTEQYEQTVKSPRRTAEQIRIATDNVESSLVSLERQYRRLAGASPPSEAVLQQISQLVTAARTARDSRPGLPAFRPQLSGELMELVQTVRGYASGLLAYQARSPFYANLSRDAQGLSVQVEALAVMLRQGQAGRAARQAMTEILNHASHISSDVRRAERPVQLGWWSVQSSLSKAAKSLGLSGEFYVQPSSPVVIHRPTLGRLPYQTGSQFAHQANREAVAVADDLLDQLEAYMATMQRLARTDASSLQILASIQNLRHSVLVFRQTAAQTTGGTALVRASDAVMSRYQETAAEVAKIVAADPALNSPVFYQIGELAQKLRYAARGSRL